MQDDLYVVWFVFNVNDVEQINCFCNVDLICIN